MNLTDWLLSNYGQEQMRPGLDRMKVALADLLPSLNQKKIVIIAGTNGKGETTLRLSQMLNDRRHVVWTSPHITRITERFRDQNGEISEELLKDIILECHERVSQKKHQLSYYEFLFLVFCTWSMRMNPEILLLEVGLGGRLDAVNVFDAQLVILPSISRDHQEILGNRYDKILIEKLGTLRKGATLIHFLESEYLVSRAKTAAEMIGANVKELRTELNIATYEFSLRNHALAGAAFCHLEKRPFVPSDWNKNDYFLENRGEILRGKKTWHFFGSHNVDGLRKLIQFLQSGTYTFERPPFDAVIVAFSKRNLQDLKVMLRMLHKAGLGKVVVTTFEHPKAASVKDMEVLSYEEGIEFVQDIESFVQGQNSNQRYLVTGSYYFLGQFKSFTCCQ